jgi:hypothetical protein
MAKEGYARNEGHLCADIVKFDETGYQCVSETGWVLANPAPELARRMVCEAA